VELDCIVLGGGKLCGCGLYSFWWANCVELYCVGFGENCGVQDYVGFEGANCVELDCISGGGGILFGIGLYNFGRCKLC
jgi:hypothetical protein